MSLLSAGALGVYRDLTDRSQRLVVSSAVVRSGAVGMRRAGTATGLIRRAGALAGTSGVAGPGVAGPGVAGPGVAGPGDEESDGGSAVTFGQLLVGQIPSEALLAYTTLLALFSGAGQDYTAGRWVLYLLSLPACAAVVASAYFVKRGYVFADDDPNANSLTALVRHLPWFPMAASVAAMAVYGLTVPGCVLQVSLTGPAFAIAAGCLAVAGGFMMSLLAPWLGRGNAAQPKPATP
jgi:hypothetical protein